MELIILATVLIAALATVDLPSKSKKDKEAENNA